MPFCDIVTKLVLSYHVLVFKNICEIFVLDKKQHVFNPFRNRWVKLCRCYSLAVAVNMVPAARHELFINALWRVRVLNPSVPSHLFIQPVIHPSMGSDSQSNRSTTGTQKSFIYPSNV